MQESLAKMPHLIRSWHLLALAGTLLSSSAAGPQEATHDSLLLAASFSSLDSLFGLSPSSLRGWATSGPEVRRSAEGVVVDDDTLTRWHFIAPRRVVSRVPHLPSVPSALPHSTVIHFDCACMPTCMCAAYLHGFADKE